MTTPTGRPTEATADRTTRGKRMKSRLNGDFLIVAGFIAVMTIFFILPIAYLLNVTQLSSMDFMMNPAAMAKSLTFKNFALVFEKEPMFKYFLNSLYYVVSANVITILVTVPTAFVIARKYIKYSNALYILFLAGIFLPDPLVPQFKLILSAGLYNTPFGYILLRINPGVTMLLLVGYFKTIPKEFEEAAGLEGCGTWRYIFRFVFPLGKPVIVTSCILFSIQVWNDIIGQSIFLTSPKHYPIIRALFSFQGVYGTNWPPLAAATFIVVAPLLALYIYFQKHIVDGIVSGGVKG
jgi:raffinose/stachyose/melibiose transport system permease protein